MRIAELVLQSLQQARVYLDTRMDACPPEALFTRLPGSSLQSVAAIYAHAVVTEDYSIHRGFQEREPLFESAAWRSRLVLPSSVALDPSWTSSFETDIPLLREYARAVYTASDRCLAALPDAALATVTRQYMATYNEGPAIEQLDVTAAFHFMDKVVLHSVEHAAEMSALLGVQGLKSSPWG